MKIEELLPDSHRGTADLATNFVIDHPGFIPTFIQEMELHGPQLAMRMSRVLALCFEIKPHLIHPYINDLLEILLSTTNNAVIRNILMIFQKAWVNLDEEKLGRLLDISFDYLENPLAEAAQRVYAMNIIFGSTKVFPELKSELQHIIEFHFEEGSAGFKARSRNILKQLNK